MVIPGVRGLSLSEFGKRLFRKFQADTVTGTSAQLSFYFLFALFPFLVFLATLMAYLPIQHAVHFAVNRLTPLMPPQAMQVLQTEFNALLQQPKPKLLTFSVLTTLWSASRGVDAVRQAMNLAYDVTENRPYWRTQALAVAMTIFGTATMLLGIVMIIAGGHAGRWVAERLGIDQAYHLAWHWMRWPLTGALIMLGAALMYWLLPAVKTEFRYITPGSLLSTVGWLLATWGFTQFSNHFGHYSVTYGSIAGVAILMLWLYLTGLVLIVGGEVNVILEHADEEGKEPGARAPGEPPLPPEQRPSAVPVGAAKTSSVKPRRWRFWRGPRHAH